MGTGVAGRAELTAPRLAAVGSWDTRLYDGLRAPRISADARAGLGAALGQIGVEAEYLLLLMSSFPGEARPSRAVGERFLGRLEIALERLVDASANLEAATQGFLNEVTGVYSGLLWAPGQASAWWPVFNGYVAPGAPLEARLRRCGFAYRQVVASYLPAHVEAILEQMALILFALNTLPPAGVLPLASLAEGLDELSSAMQGEIVPRHIRGLSGDPRYPGALAAMERLRALDAAEDTSLESDITWARAEYVTARDDETKLAGQERAHAVAAHDAYEWATVVGLLEGMRRYEPPRR